MFPMLSIWNPRLINPSVAVIFRQSFKVKQLTPISSYHHFLRNEDETAKRKTGFGLTKHNLLFNICKTIHSNEALFKNLNSPGQKIVVEKQKAEKLEKHEVTIDALEEGKQLGLFARFKKMAKDYWYVFIPVHVTTSFCWLGAFYYTSTSGVDIIGILEHYHFSETFIKPIRNSSLGHAAIAYFLYKIATPARYFVTLTGTTFTIKQGIKHGLIKPMPSKDALVQIYKSKKDDLKEKVADKKQAFQDRKQVFQDKYMKKE